MRRRSPGALPTWKRGSDPGRGASMQAIDTNVLVRLVVRDEPAQVEKAEAFVGQGAWVSHLVLAETVWVLESVYGLSREQIATVVGMLVEHDRLTLQDEDVIRRAHSAFERDSSVGFTDCLIVEAARKAGHLPVGTFDRAMSRIDGGQGL